jgi:hypothetical protein
MVSSRGNFLCFKETSLAASCSNALAASARCRGSLVATQLHAGTSIATTHATLTRTGRGSSTAAAQPWAHECLTRGLPPAAGPCTPAFEKLVCEVTVVLRSSEGPTSDSTPAPQTRLARAHEVAVVGRAARVRAVGGFGASHAVRSELWGGTKGVPLRWHEGRACTSVDVSMQGYGKRNGRKACC